MGCGGSKVDDLPLVTFCRERKNLIKAASDHRYALAASHVSYFQSLKDVGDALRRFVDEELVIGASSSSPLDSPVLTLPSDQGKKKKTNDDGNKSSSSSTSLSHHHSSDNDGSHLHFASDSDSAEIQPHSSPIPTNLGNYYPYYAHNSPNHTNSYPNAANYYPYYAQTSPNHTNSNPNGVNYYSYHAKKSTTAIPTFVYEDPRQAQWPESLYTGEGGYFGTPMASSGYEPPPYYNRQQSPPPPAVPPSPPSPPKYSAWDFLNPFELENTYPTYYPGGRYGVGSISSSPDSVEVRQREGIPDLEDETEQETVKQLRKDKQKVEENVTRDFGEGTSTSVPFQNENRMGSVEEKDIQSSPHSVVSTRAGEDEVSAKKGVTFGAEEQSVQEAESSMPSSLTTLSTNSTRDIQEAIQEVRDEFEIASGFGKEVGLMLEAGKSAYHPRNTFLKVISSRVLNLVAPSVLPSHPLSMRSSHATAHVMKMARAKYEDSDDFQRKSGSLSSTLERLYVWEKKLYKEVKDEERLRVIYEKKCKRLKVLDVRGAESNKIDATQASIRKLLTKIDIAIKTVDSIANRIHKLRDEELQPQITDLISGLIKMWKSMLKCHQKQYHAIIESKSRMLMARTGSRRDSSLRATVELELELVNWCTNFSEWISIQKAYVESLNGWLLRCLHQEPEESIDGMVPFSPSRMGAPPVFIICKDWYQAVENLSVTEVANTMRAFAMNLHELWERQDEEQRQRLKAEYLFKDFEKRRLGTLRKEGTRMHHRDRDALSEKSTMSVVRTPSESGVSPLDDLKVDLDSMRKRLEEEKARHEETIKEVHEAASTSLQSGLVPIFEALGNFTSETLKAYEQVRIQNAEVR